MSSIALATLQARSSLGFPTEGFTKEALVPLVPLLVGAGKALGGAALRTGLGTLARGAAGLGARGLASSLAKRYGASQFARRKVLMDMASKHLRKAKALRATTGAGLMGTARNRVSAAGRTALGRLLHSRGRARRWKAKDFMARMDPNHKGPLPSAARAADRGMRGPGGSRAYPLTGGGYGIHALGNKMKFGPEQIQRGMRGALGALGRLRGGGGALSTLGNLSTVGLMGASMFPGALSAAGRAGARAVSGGGKAAKYPGIGGYGRSTDYHRPRVRGYGSGAFASA
jgi:hypothetical protein